MQTLDAIETKIRAGQLDQAKRELDAVGAAPENSARAKYLRGYLKEMQYDRAGALAEYEKSLAESPDDVATSFRAARICEAYGDDDAALDLYERCTQNTPARVNALINLAVLYDDMGRYFDAENLLEAIVDEHPNHARAQQMLRSIESSLHMVFDEQTQRDREKRSALLDTPITDFELSVRSRNCLRQMNIRTLGDLLRTGEGELLSYKNFGETSLNEIKALLAQRGLRLGQSLAPVEAPVTVAEPVAAPADVSVHARRSVSELELSVRSRKALMRLGVTTLGELAQRSEPELMSIKNFGMTSLTEIKRQLTMYGMSLRRP